VHGIWLDIKKGSNMFPPRMLVRIVKLVNLARLLVYAWAGSYLANRETWLRQRL